MCFQTLELSLEIIHNLRKPVHKLRNCDDKLADQIRRAGSSISLNLAEGNRRVGKDRQHFWRIAAGSADEVRTALRVAEAWGYLGASEIGQPLELLDSCLAMLWRLTH